MKDLWSIAVDAPLKEPLTYTADSNLAGSLQRGQLVELPLGKRKTTGVVLGPQDKAPDFELKSIQSIVSEYPPLPSSFLNWLEWVSKYYIYPLGSIAQLAYPKLSKNLKTRKSNRPPVVRSFEPVQPPELNTEQSKVLREISQRNGFNVHLLFGVTGSGKTEVYLRLLEKTLQEGKQALVLVPEISLTPQLVQRFGERFGDQIAVLHSQLTDRERTNQWWEIVEGQKKILIGARSALFCPMKKLGLVIVDEEHEPSFKQEEKLKYHGRDCAIMLARFFDCPIVLGTATPSLESWKNAQEGKYLLHTMRHRVESRPLPTMQVVDMRVEKPLGSELPFWLSQELHQAIDQTLAQSKQVALFLNRRGIAPMVLCGECGFTHECPNCDINLTLHGSSSLVCHYCDYALALTDLCPDCKEGEMKKVGLGTEQVQQEIQKLFPQARIARADRDEIQNRTDMEELIAQMENSTVDILIGTQMIAKGLDFPRLQLVGLILADVGFNLPDFRALERSFQLITQVSGRAGRHVKAGESAGQVIIQTYNPHHPSLIFALQKDFAGYAQFELIQRKELNYPPYGRLIGLRIQGTQLTKVQEACRLVSQRAMGLKKTFEKYAGIEVLGPSEAPISKLRGQFRFHLLLKGNDSQALHNFYLQLTAKEEWLPAGVRLVVDVDPIQLL